jgi:hypothetical protein
MMRCAETLRQLLQGAIAMAPIAQTKSTGSSDAFGLEHRATVKPLLDECVSNIEAVLSLH